MSVSRRLKEKARRQRTLTLENDGVGGNDESIKITPQNFSAYKNRGNVKHVLGDSLGVIDDYDEAIRINPQTAGTYYNRGNVKRALGDEAGASADHAMAKKFDPANFSEKIG